MLQLAGRDSSPLESPVILWGVREPILIDTDTASDDVVALIMALRSARDRVIGITTVAGNVSVEQGTRNALYTTDLCGMSTPVYQGAAKPLTRRLFSAHWFHGRDGLGDHGYPPPRRSAEKQHAVDAIVSIIRNNPGLLLVTLGPLTNIALALAQAPDIVRNVGRCVVMGGAPCCEGNVTPAAEYNIWVDPEAARIVFHSHLPLEMVGWQLCRGAAVIGPSDIQFVNDLGTDLSRFAVECNSTGRKAFREQTGEDGISLPDPVAMSIALDPSIGVESSRHYVEIETASELTRGMTVVDRLGVAGNDRNRGTWAELLDEHTNDPHPNVKVYWTIDAPRWKQALYAALR
jgi:purine nucleosidase